MEAEYCEDIQKIGYYKECLGKKNRKKVYIQLMAWATLNIKNLKKANMTVAWTTEEQRFRAADINAMINSVQ